MRRKPGVKEIAAVVGIALVLSGCVEDDSSPIATTTPVAIAAETGIPEPLTCSEHAAVLEANRPEPGSPEWNRYVGELSVPYIEGESHSEVLSAFVHASVDSLAGGIQDLPTNVATLKDCRQEIKELTGSIAPNTSLGGGALDTILGIGWRADAAAEALVDPTTALGPQEVSGRKTIYLSIAYQTLQARLANELGDLEPDFVIHDESARLDDTEPGIVRGSIDVTELLVGHSDDFGIGGRLEPINGRWISVGKDY